MSIIFGILLFFVLGGLVLRFSKKFKFPVWKGLLCLVCWILGGSLVVTVFFNMDGPNRWLWLLFITLVIASPFLLIWLIKMIGKFCTWALGGWNSDDD